MKEQTLTITDLMKATPDNLRNFSPYQVDTPAPESVLKYNPAIWQEKDGVWHTLLGAMPKDCIWTLGTTVEESMQEFDKEIKKVLQPDGTIKFLPEHERNQLHYEVGIKIDGILSKIFDSFFGRLFSSN